MSERMYPMAPWPVQLDALRAQKDAAYSERNQVLALLARVALELGWRVGVGHQPAEDTAWEADWRTILFIDLPTGQACWHYHDSERHLLAGLPPYPAQWDGHSTPEKYERVRAALPIDVPSYDAANGRAAIRNAALEEAAAIAEGGRFLHEEAPDARFGRACAAAIRRAKTSASPSASLPPQQAEVPTESGSAPRSGSGSSGASGGGT